MNGPLVSPSWLRERLDDPGVRVVDCRFKLGEPGAGEELWRAAHIPGAEAWVDEEAGHMGDDSNVERDMAWLAQPDPLA